LPLKNISSIWQEVRGTLLQLGTERNNCRYKEEQIADHEQAMDEAFVEKANLQYQSQRV